MPPRNDFYGNSFQPYPSTIFPNYQYNTQTPMAPINTQVQPQQNQNIQSPQTNGFIYVKSRQEAEQWPMGPGESLTFKDVSKPYQYYSKSRGLSQFDEPVFESFHLVKDGDEVLTKNEEINSQAQTSKLQDEMDKLVKKVEDLSMIVDKLTTACIPTVRTTTTACNTEGGMMRHV